MKACRVFQGNEEYIFQEKRLIQQNETCGKILLYMSMSWGQACERELFFKIKDQTGMGTGGDQVAMSKLKLECGDRF